MMPGLLIPILNTQRLYFFFFQAEDGIRDVAVTGVQTCALPILGKGMSRGPKGQPRQAGVAGPAAVSLALIIPNPKLKLLDQVREVMRLRHYSIHTERSYCDWIRRYIHFHGMQGRADLAGGESK